MTLKQSPSDFRVEELTLAAPEPAGDFAVYRLDKEGWTTPDAVAVVAERWKLDPRRISFGGLKDRHAVTSQHVTVFRGPGRDLSHPRLTLTYLGRRPAPFTAADITANRFAVTLRDLSPADVDRAAAAAEEVRRVGVPNYFDDQRFGSVAGAGGPFVAREMVFGRFEEALKLALTAPYEFDRADAKREKQLLRTHWGDWPRLLHALPRGHARRSVEHLAARPADFRGAVSRLRPDLQGLYLAAYQSELWNRMLGRWLTRFVPAADLGRAALKLGPVPVPVRLADDSLPAWEGLTLPLPSARVRPEPGDVWGQLAADVLAEEGLTLSGLKVKGMREPFFSKGDRPGCVRPAGFALEPGADERHPGQRKLVLRFDLPRGSYATMVVKRLTATEPGAVPSTPGGRPAG